MYIGMCGQTTIMQFTIIVYVCNSLYTITCLRLSKKKLYIVKDNIKKIVIR